MRPAAYILTGAALLAAPFLFGQAGQAKRPSAAKPKPAAKTAPAPPKPAVPKPQEPASLAAYPLESVRVEGSRQIPSARVTAASGLRVGLEVTKRDFDEARERLLATGAFESVGYEYKPNASASGYEAVLQVIEAPQFFPYRFEDLPVAEAALRTAVQQAEPIFGDRIPPSKAVLDRLTAVVQKAAGVPVVGKVAGERGSPEVLFYPAASRPNIADVRFTGNEALPTPLLTRTLSAVAIGVPYTEASFRQLLEASLRPLYEARGRIRVEFPRVTSAKAERVEGVVVTTAIREGEAYRLAAVRWEGVLNALKQDVEKAANLKTGDIANFDDVQAGLKRVNERYLSAGFLKQSSRVERDVQDATHEVNLTVKVDAGPQYTMGKLTINGLDILSEPTIRKMWRLDPGKPFQSEYPDAFLKRIRDEDMFDNLGKTTADASINETTHVVDVTLNFAGARAEKSKTKF